MSERPRPLFVERLSPALALTLPQLWTVMAVVLPMIALPGALGTIDLAYQVRAGDLMLDTHALIRSDTFTFTAFGLPWIDQQWAAQLLFALVYRVGGWPGLALTELGLAGAVFLFVYLACRASGGPVRHSSWLTLGGAAVALTGLTLRPQLLGALLFAVMLWLLAGRRSHPARLWAVVAVQVVWVNMHGSFVLGPLMIGLAGLEDLHDRSPRARSTFLAAIASAAASLLNPFGLGVWSYAIGISTNRTISRLVQEWQPPTLRRFDDVIFFLSVAAVAALFARKNRPVSWPRLVTFAVFLLLALMATRNVLWWALAIPPTIAGMVAEGPAPIRREIPGSLLNTGIAAALVAMVFVLFSASLEGGSFRVPGHRVADAPVALTARLRATLRAGDRVFNAQRWGSWLEFALPQNRVFVDSRIEIFPSAVWKDYLDVSNARDGWQQILDRWKIKVVAADRGQQDSLIPLIRHDPGWRQVYGDEHGFIFVREGPPP